ncbi:MAG TPA: polymer-forming cytoskeletal protein [Chloroflexota bacterium]|nr:polymer-forming cytoskeletal protein [Chloroflexota bacterium]
MGHTVIGAALAVLLLALSGTPALALERRSGDSIVVARDEVIDEDFAASGRLVRVDGTVRGDLYAFAQHLTVAGIVEGDVIAVAQEVVIDGQVRGSVRAGGATVQINGAVDRNVTSAGQLVRLGSGGRVGGTVIGAGETLSLAGDVGGGLYGAGQSVLMQGRVNRNVDLALDRLQLAPGASVGGNFDYHSDRPVPPMPPAVVAGATRFHPVTRPQRVERTQINRFAGAVGNFFSLTWLAGSAAVGLVMLRAFPRFVARYLDALERSAGASFGVGFVALVATVPLALVLAITIVGLPASAILVGGWLGGMFVGWLLLAIAVGSVLIGLLRRGHERRLAWSFLLGLLVLYLATRVPFLGPLVTFVGLSLGLGALVIALYRTWKRAELNAPADPYVDLMAGPLT